VRKNLIYLPFLAWAVIYFFFHTLLNRFGGDITRPPLSAKFFISGETNHLWFLPYILVAGLVTFPLAQRLVHGVRHAQWIIALALFVGLATAAISKPLFLLLLNGYTQSGTLFMYRAFTLTPCIFIGIGVYFLFQIARHSTHKMSKYLALFGGALFVSSIVYNCLLPTNPVLETIAGLGLALLTFWPKRTAFLTKMGTLGRFSYGMYLVHMIFVDICKTVRTHVFQMAPTWWYDMLTLLACILLSLGAAILLSRYRLTRWLIAAPPPDDERASTGASAAKPQAEAVTG